MAIASQRLTKEMAWHHRQLPADVYPETLSRLPPLKRETLNEAQQKAYDAVTAPRSGRLNLAGIKGPGGVILRMPKLAKPLGDVNRVLRSELGLDARLVELTILATAREMQSQFEWAMHEPVALEVGVPAATIDMIRHGKPLKMCQKKKLRSFISRARRWGRSRLRQRRTRQPWRFLAKKSYFTTAC